MADPRAWLFALAACGGAPESAAKLEPVKQPEPAKPWPTPADWKSETIPFPLGFAPTLAHTGVEELRFAPSFSDPAAPGYWSYTFTWRTENAAALDAAALGGELTTYFKGLAAAVDAENKVAGRDTIAVTAVADGKRFKLAAHMFDVFKTHKAVELTGWAERTACGTGALWVFVLAPEASPLRGELDTLASRAACGQPVDR